MILVNSIQLVSHKFIQGLVFLLPYAPSICSGSTGPEKYPPREHTGQSVTINPFYYIISLKFSYIGRKLLNMRWVHLKSDLSPANGRCTRPSPGQPACAMASGDNSPGRAVGPPTYHPINPLSLTSMRHSQRACLAREFPP